MPKLVTGLITSDINSSVLTAVVNTINNSCPTLTITVRKTSLRIYVCASITKMCELSVSACGKMTAKIIAHHQ